MKASSIGHLGEGLLNLEVLDSIERLSSYTRLAQVLPLSFISSECFQTEERPLILTLGFFSYYDFWFLHVSCTLFFLYVFL